MAQRRQSAHRRITLLSVLRPDIYNCRCFNSSDVADTSRVFTSDFKADLRFMRTTFNPVLSKMTSHEQMIYAMLPVPSLKTLLGIAVVLGSFCFVMFPSLLLKGYTSPFILVEGKHYAIPFLSQLHWYRDGPSIIHSSYRKLRNIIFQVPSTDRLSIVLPLRYLKEISALPHSVASVSHATSDFFVGRWTTLDYEVFGNPTLDAVRAQYIVRLGQQIGDVSEELSFAFSKQFPAYPDWTPVTFHPKVLSTIAQTVSRTIVGPELCRDPAWIRDSIGYAQNLFMAAVGLKFLPLLLRPVFIIFTPYIYRIHLCRYRIIRKLSPHIKQRIEWRDNHPDYFASRLKVESPSTVDWVVKNSGPLESSPELIARRVLGVALGATHTTTNHIANCILDLAAGFDDYAPQLREEIEQVIGSKTTEITSVDLAKMWKLDSFMKETQRFHPPSKLSVNRKIMRPVTLSTGESLPVGAHISFAGVPASMDDDQFENASQFDPFRFERLRKDPETRHHGLQFTSAYEGTLHFGHGHQMCPGRFMGSILSKLLIIEILQKYDLKLEEGRTRPDSILFGDMDIPNPQCTVLFRTRR
ncbi:putative cytochrome P450 [Xylariaceae sp. FL1272]|nr:putative cytochrome P450 [Xylariaceae sp. FL1272]